jgi:hypothetical protein
MAVEAIQGQQPCSAAARECGEHHLMLLQTVQLCQPAKRVDCGHGDEPVAALILAAAASRSRAP